MKIEKMNLWKETPGLCEEIPTLTAYVPDEKRSNIAIVIFPGGGYQLRSPHEGDGYARFLAENGYTAFVADGTTGLAIRGKYEDKEAHGMK